MYTGLIILSLALPYKFPYFLASSFLARESSVEDLEFLVMLQYMSSREVIVTFLAILCFWPLIINEHNVSIICAVHGQRYSYGNSIIPSSYM